MAALEREVAAYNRLLPTLLPQLGKYALIKNDDVVDTFDSYQDAVKRGYADFKLEPFLVKQIAPAEQVAFFTRDLVPCQA